ncbi:MAG: hypothetical protein QOE45_500 [Frankiaceae bacterium]|nr:hypothetical protein [Frankiaceae bacterium]
MSTGIDATVVLGLAGKAATVFAEEGTYLSFPLGPVGIEASRLKALVADPFSPEGAQALTEFSLLVNEIPAGPLWQPDGDRLWDVYGDVLAHSDLADAPPRTEAEEQKYRTAYDLLYQVAGDGTVTASAVVVTYEQRRDAYLAAIQEYNNRKSEAAVSTDAEVAKAWAADEPKLKGAVDEAEQDWAVAGRRDEVGDARRVLRDLASRSPAAAWADYRKQYDPDLPEIYFRTSPDGSSFVPTGYLPSDVVDAAWPTITATREELAALSASAPAELRARLESSDDAEVESVSFQYSTVTVSRPWFTPGALASRAWRFRDKDRVLSDGATPPAGECAAYVTGLVLARNITVRRPAAAGTTPSLGFLPIAKLSAATSLRARPYTLALRATAVAEPAAAPPAEPTVSRVAMRGSFARMAARPLIARESVAGESPIVTTGIRATGRPFAKDLLLSRITSTRLGIMLPPRHTLPPPPPESTETTSDPDEIYVLAFVCRTLPKAPDPDDSLSWP